MLTETPKFRRSELMKAKPEALVRLAKFLKLDVEGMSHRQISKLIMWRLHRNRMWYR